MKARSAVSLVAFVFLWAVAGLTFAADPDVQKGYDKHQKWYKEKEESKKQEQNKDDKQKESDKNYEVIKSGDGHGGVPTTGGFVPSDIKNK